MFPVCVQVRRLVCDPSRHKLLVLAGQCVEDTGDIVLQKGCFSLNHFLHIFADEEVRNVSGWVLQNSPVTLLKQVCDRDTHKAGFIKSFTVWNKLELN